MKKGTNRRTGSVFERFVPFGTVQVPRGRTREGTRTEITISQNHFFFLSSFREHVPNGSDCVSIKFSSIRTASPRYFFASPTLTVRTVSAALTLLNFLSSRTSSVAPFVVVVVFAEIDIVPARYPSSFLMSFRDPHCLRTSLICVTVSSSAFAVSCIV